MPPFGPDEVASADNRQRMRPETRRPQTCRLGGGHPDARWHDAGWLAAAVDVEQHRIEGRCPACDLDGCEVLTAAELIVATVADPTTLPNR
jgi:hypothetical protein